VTVNLCNMDAGVMSFSSKSFVIVLIVVSVLNIARLHCRYVVSFCLHLSLLYFVYKERWDYVVIAVHLYVCSANHLSNTLIDFNGTSIMPPEPHLCALTFSAVDNGSLAVVRTCDVWTTLTLLSVRPWYILMSTIFWNMFLRNVV
jgi:hypothetical protein